jgi:hypothetical protein
MAKVWRVYLQDTQSRYYWFETKKEADAYAQECRRENDLEDPEKADVTVDSEDFETTRKGLVKALNYVISLTCFNEG